MSNKESRRRTSPRSRPQYKDRHESGSSSRHHSGERGRSGDRRIHAGGFATHREEYSQQLQSFQPASLTQRYAAVNEAYQQESPQVQAPAEHDDAIRARPVHGISQVNTYGHRGQDEMSHTYENLTFTNDYPRKSEVPVGNQAASPMCESTSSHQHTPRTPTKYHAHRQLREPATSNPMYANNPNKFPWEQSTLVYQNSHQQKKDYVQEELSTGQLESHPIYVAHSEAYRHVGLQEGQQEDNPQTSNEPTHKSIPIDEIHSTPQTTNSPKDRIFSEQPSINVHRAHISCWPSSHDQREEIVSPQRLSHVPVHASFSPTQKQIPTESTKNHAPSSEGPMKKQHKIPKIDQKTQEQSTKDHSTGVNMYDDLLWTIIFAASSLFFFFPLGIFSCYFAYQSHKVRKQPELAVEDYRISGGISVAAVILGTCVYGIMGYFWSQADNVN